MKRQFASLSITVLFAFLLIDADEPKNRDVVHGTINLVLANGNGAVVLTDSMLTEGNKQLVTPGQKLFRIDDKTVCTIAGFISAGPGGSLGNAEKDLAVNAGAIVNDYVAQYKANNLRMSLEGKLALLTAFLNVDISVLSSARNAVGASTPLGLYELQVTMVGYDDDGFLKIGRMVLKTTQQKNFLSSKTAAARIQSVGESLAWEISGIDLIARPSLEDPEREQQKGGLVDFAMAMRKDGGKSLSLDQLKTVARTLADRTAAKYPGVGGKYQIALLKNGKILSYEQDSFPLYPSPTHLSIAAGMTITRNAFVTNERMAFVGNTFKGDERTIDNNYFFNNEFLGGTLFYNGGKFVFDKSNKTRNTTLHLGKKVNRDDPSVRRLIQEFPWSKIE